MASGELNTTRANWVIALTGGAVLGAVVGAAIANHSRPGDVITGRVSIDLLKKVELLTIRLHLDRT